MNTKELWQDIKCITTLLATILTASSLIFALGTVLSWPIGNYPVTVYYGELPVYHGSNKCVKVLSAGDITGVYIYSESSWCLIEQNFIVANNIRIESGKE